MGFGRYMGFRVINAVVVLVLVVFICSLLFNTFAEQEVKAMIDEIIRAMTVSNPQLMQKLRSNQTAYQIWVEEQKKLLYEEFGLNKPYLQRVFERAINQLQFKFGKATMIRSPSGSTDVATIILEALPRTVLLFTTAEIIVIIIGILLGLKAAQKAGSFLDRSIQVVSMVSASLPMWWVGMLMIIVFSYYIPAFPSGGFTSIPPPPPGIPALMDLLYHLALPVITVVLVSFGAWAYVTRSLVLGTLQEDFIMVARAKGIPERKVLYGHTLRAAAPPILTNTLLSLIASMGGAVITESVFNWPGLGRLYWIAIEEFDVPVLLGLTTVFTMLYLAAFVLQDLIYGLLDPRVRIGAERR